jgi:DNA-binding CsgD family transcriptional regulator
VTVVVGVDGAGRTHRLEEIAARSRKPVLRVTPTAPASDLAARLDAALAGGEFVLVDDAHRLEAGALRTLAAAARRGLPMAIGRRPSIDGPELAELDEAVAAGGPVEHLGPLSPKEVAALLVRAAGRPPSPDAVSAVLSASAGLAVVASALAAAPGDQAPPALVARVHRRLATLDPELTLLARVLALRLDLTDDVLAAAAAMPGARLAAAMRTLRDAGLLVPGGDRMIPAVAQAVLADLPPAERRRVSESVAAALLAGGADPLAAAAQLRSARARTPRAAEAYRTAGDRLRFADPAAALQWYDDALDAGADPASLAVGRAEAAALLGMPVDLDDPGTAAAAAAADRARLAVVAGAVAAQQGRAARSAEALRAAGPLGDALAVPALLATGRLEDARRAAEPPAGAGVPASVRRLAEAALAAVEPGTALPRLIEAAEEVERVPPAAVLPDTPHALAAVVAVTAGDAATAEHLLRRALATGVGGPVAAERHRLLLAWVHLRTGRYDTPLAEMRRLAAAPLPGRERVLLAAVSAGIARRSGDIARIRESWASVEQALARRAVDLFQVEPLEELAVAAARVRQQQRIAPVLALLDDVVERLGRPVAWHVAAGWVRLQVAVAGEDGEAAAAIAGRLSAVEPAGLRQRALVTAAGLWAALLAGRVEPDAVLAGAERLLAAELPWEASRLVGQAAIRTADPSAARRLLERARELSHPEPSAAAAAESAGRADPRLAGLSEREIEVARLVLAGRTHRDIGAQLYISPKTVEHHVARIRTKLGATSRAEFVAAIREVLDDDGRRGA